MIDTPAAIPELSFDELAATYCGRHESTPDSLREILTKQRDRYTPVGWMLLECVMMDSSMMGSYTILPFGPENTFKAPPTGPVSPWGLASDMSVVRGIVPTQNLINHE